MRKPIEKKQPPKIDYRHGLAPELEPVRAYSRADGHFYHENIGRDVLAALRRSRGRKLG